MKKRINCHFLLISLPADFSAGNIVICVQTRNLYTNRTNVDKPNQIWSTIHFWSLRNFGLCRKNQLENKSEMKLSAMLTESNF